MGKPSLRYSSTENIPEFAIMQEKILIVSVINQLKNVQFILIIILKENQPKKITKPDPILTLCLWANPSKKH